MATVCASDEADSVFSSALYTNVLNAISSLLL